MTEEEKTAYIRETVHHEYYTYDTNCACTTLLCLSHLFSFPLPESVMDAALGMHGAGGYRAQCGLVEGTLMFLGVYLTAHGVPRAGVIEACRAFAGAFEKKFGSLTCRELRPQGFHEGQPPHMCETRTDEAILFSSRFVEDICREKGL